MSTFFGGNNQIVFSISAFKIVSLTSSTIEDRRYPARPVNEFQLSAMMALKDLGIDTPPVSAIFPNVDFESQAAFEQWLELDQSSIHFDQGVD